MVNYNDVTIRATDDEDRATQLWGDNKRYDENRQQWTRKVTEDEYNDAVSRNGKPSYTRDDQQVVRAWLEEKNQLSAEQIDEAVGSDDHDGGASSPGKTSSASSTKPAKTESGASKDRQSTAPMTDTSSPKAQTARGSASSTGGSGKASK